MVYENSRRQRIIDPNYQNEVFRARHHYKEELVHDPPQRKNRDFKAVPYGSFRGMLNFKHAEPFLMLKSLKDIYREEHHHPIKWASSSLQEAYWVHLLVTPWYIVQPTAPFVQKKLMNAVGTKLFSGQLLRFVWQALPPYFLLGGSFMLTYSLIYEYLRGGHEGYNERPQFFDHTATVTILGALAGLMFGPHPKYFFTGGIAALFIVSPLSFWIQKQGRFQGNNIHANIYYLNGTSKEEVERIRHLDEIESLADDMQARPAYGYFSYDQRYV
eukprot:CAMPEP_0202960460 /NCGR_PEP_ID=MMETSP1396-20130829/4607_1 /ASSEMBLY_ACC=CAM_ASM_000872 /TAXON_ID= /ORGANISM="Pseudokeronopsis sp., Strain Brazil" /LENGTH=271 /DNA_ID=CAMNT_0049679693 /DNA_START=6 /DNA_END=821 /DNA_ORIENTATION=+